MAICQPDSKGPLMDSAVSAFDLLRDLELRHDELLARLTELDKRVEQALAECQHLRVRPDVAVPVRKAG